MNVLEEAASLINGQRSKDYGHPRDNFNNIASLWTAYLGYEIDPLDVGLMMVLLKVARLESGVYQRDSIVDIAGYAGTLERIFEEPVADLDVMPESRVWQSILEVPTDITVTDVDDCKWKFIGDHWHYDVDDYWERGADPIETHDQDCPPFTEVLETTA